MLPLLGIVFRSAYGGFVLALSRYALWMALLFGAHSDRTHDERMADVPRALGTALVPSSSRRCASRSARRRSSSAG